ncbi:hypothetical protein IMCC1989_2444 [gamma proteobacterium IMCC1989]|nr:hypothetical protein IMCC1989_2444 [gamma proteobacterium IMCC1989]
MTYDRDFIWQCDYGERQPVLNVIGQLLDSQNEYELGMCSFFVNNNPYQLEFFVVFGYETPKDSKIQVMKEKMLSVGARFRVDIIFDEMTKLSTKKRFNSFVVSTSDQIGFAVENTFQFADRAYVSSKVPMGPLGAELPIFLSHSTIDKPFVEELIPYLSRHGLAVWYDKLNISYGESITSAIMNGIDDSGAVIFFITESFLSSNWCKEEMESFLSRAAEGDKILPISVVFPNIEHSQLPRFIKNKKYLKLNNGTAPSIVANELVPTFKDFFSL